MRSLENFKHSTVNHTTPNNNTSPDRWLFPSSRTSAPAITPPTRLFHAHKPPDTQNLLQSPDDVFSPPPVPVRSSHDIFGATPFVVGGRENGTPVFLLANQHTVDVVRLTPPIISPYRTKVMWFCFLLCLFGLLIGLLALLFVWLLRPRFITPSTHHIFYCAHNSHAPAIMRKLSFIEGWRRHAGSHPIGLLLGHGRIRSVEVQQLYVAIELIGDRTWRHCAAEHVKSFVWLW